MKQQRAYRKKCPTNYRTLSLLLLAFSLSSCGQTADPLSVVVGTSTPSSPALTATVVGTLTSGPTAPTLTVYAAATLTVAELMATARSGGATAAAVDTRRALTVIPLEQTALARPTPTLYILATLGPEAPEPTPILGLQPGCAPSIHDFNQSNCWITLLNNEYIYVDAGYKYNVVSGDLADESIGTLVVVGNGPTMFYPTPQRLGPVHITAVTGSRVTVVLDNAPPNSVSFIFDLAMLQWINANGTPLPTPTRLPPATP